MNNNSVLEEDHAIMGEDSSKEEAGCNHNHKNEQVSMAPMQMEEDTPSTMGETTGGGNPLSPLDPFQPLPHETREPQPQQQQQPAHNEEEPTISGPSTAAAAANNNNSNTAAAASGSEEDDEEDAKEASSSDSAASSSRSGDNKGHSSSSGTGGYSADCSASDQSSDESANKNKGTGNSTTGPTTTNNNNNPLLLMNQLDIHDPEDEDPTKGSSHTKQGNNNSHNTTTAGDQARTGRTATISSSTTGMTKSSSHGALAAAASSRRRKESHALMDDTAMTMDEAERDLEQILQSRRASQTGMVSSSLAGLPTLPLKSPDILDIEAIWKARAQLELENASFFGKTTMGGTTTETPNPLGATTTAATASSQLPLPPIPASWLPQFNGIRVGNPMDPRIDLSSVSVLPNTENSLFPIPLPPPPPTTTSSSAAAAEGNGQATGSGESIAKGESKLAGDATETPTVNSYIQLMEMVRPFFLYHGVLLSNHLLANQQQQQQMMQQQQQQPQEQQPLQEPDSHGTATSSDAVMADATTAVEPKLPPPPSSQQQQQDSTSEGFTSFFTTTHSSQQSGSSSGEGGQKRPPPPPPTSAAATTTSSGTTMAQPHGEALPVAHGKRRTTQKDDNDDDEDTNKSDSSSMVVLARTKRKHLAKASQKGDQEANGEPQTTAANTTTTAAGGERRVRIQEKKQTPNADDGEEEDSSSSAMDQKPKGQDQSAVATAASLSAAPAKRKECDDSPESSASSSSAAPPPPPGAAFHHHHLPHHHHHLHHHNHREAVPPRIVTDISSSNRTDSTGPSAASSGSAGNTGSGSGSGQGSSGSGNEFNKGSASEEGGKVGSSEEGGKAGSSEEGKGGSASEEQIPAGGEAKGGNTEAGSDQSDTKIHSGALVAKARDPSHHHPHHHQGVDNHHHHHKKEPPTPGPNAAVAPAAASSSLARKENIEAERERKLQDKKRKRIEMRREYEAQQYMESSESSDRKPENLFRPGKPISFDQVLQFSKIPRVVIQSTYPFLIVHSNAAFTRLTGIDAHKVTGKPIRHVLSLPNDAAMFDRQVSRADGEHSSSASGNPQASVSNQNTVYSSPSFASVDGRGRPTTDMTSRGRRHYSRNQSTLERLVAASGFGRLHLVHVVSKNRQLVGKSVAFHKEGPPVGGTSSSASGMISVHANTAAVDRRTSVRGTRDQSLSSGASTPKQAIACHASIAPIVSEQSSLFHPHPIEDDDHDQKRRKLASELHVGTGVARPGVKEHDDKEFSAKRRKLPASTSLSDALGNRRNMVGSSGKEQRQVVTHYVIQLEEDNRNLQAVGSLESLSSQSTSVEAQLLNLSKQELRHQRKVTLGTESRHGESTVAVEMIREPEDEAGSESTPHEPVSAVG